MTTPPTHDPDAITATQAAELLGLSEIRVSRLRREGLPVRRDGHPSYSRADVQAFIDNPWLNGPQAALILDVSHTRVAQLLETEKIPTHVTAGGRPVYRLEHLEEVARARQTRLHPSARTDLAAGVSGRSTESN
jgi:hypothetical protein